MMNETDTASLFRSFMYEVNKATASLMYLLQGMESVRNSELPHYNQETPGTRQFLANFPKLSNIGVPLTLTGADFDLNDLLKREGETEQLAFKGWVEQVYNCIWDSRYRNELTKSFEGPSIIKLQGAPIGDLRRIRNDLIHKGGIASAEHTGKCMVLKWFKPGDPIILGMRHVFDFLNQMGLMSTVPASFQDRAAHVNWMPIFDEEDALRNIKPTPKLVSLRTSMDQVLEDGSSLYVISVVFENGVFTNIPVEYAANGRSQQERNEFISRVRIDEDGNVRFPNGNVKDRETLYGEAVDGLFHKGPQVSGRGIPGPTFRFRK